MMGVGQDGSVDQNGAPTIPGNGRSGAGQRSARPKRSGTAPKGNRCVEANSGSIDGPGPVVAEGMLFVTAGTAGNV